MALLSELFDGGMGGMNTEDRLEIFERRKLYEKGLFEELKELRTKGISEDMLLDLELLPIAIDCPSNALVNFDNDFTWAILDHAENDRDVFVLLAVYGLSEEYRFEDITLVTDRRKAYCAAIGAKPDTMIRTETALLDSLAKKLAEDVLSDKSKPILSAAFRRRKNEYFVGRMELLLEIHKRFKSGSYVSLVQQISGLGGIGKTQTAQEYAFRFRRKYDLIGWIDAETNRNILSGIKRVLVSIGEIAENETNASAIRDKAQNWFETHDRWLLIFDNVEDFEQVTQFFPRHIRGNILLTSRASANHVGEVLNLNVFTENESLRFFKKRVRKPYDQESAKKLAMRLGYFPLALEQAAAYIEAVPNMSFKGYLHRLEQFGLKVLDSPMKLKDYTRTVRETLEISLENIHDASEGAIALSSAEQFLYLCSYVAPDEIDTWAFRRYPDLLPEPLHTDMFDELAWDSVLSSLTKFSLMKPDKDYGYSIHRLLQEVIREKLHDDVFWITCCFESFYKLISDRSTVKEDAGAFINRSPHAIAVAEYMDAVSEQPDERLAAMYHWFSYSMAGSDYFMFFDIKHMNRAIEIYEELLGANDPETGIAYLCMSDIYDRNGETALADSWQQKANAAGVVYPNSDRVLFFDWFNRKLSGYYEKSEKA